MKSISHRLVVDIDIDKNSPLLILKAGMETEWFTSDMMLYESLSLREDLGGCAAEAQEKLVSGGEDWNLVCVYKLSRMH